MTKQNQPATAQAMHKPQPKLTPAPEVGGGVADPQTGTQVLVGPPSLQGHAERLDDPRQHLIQRQRLATQIGQVQGNGHLQEIVGAISRSKNISNGLGRNHVSTRVNRQVSSQQRNNAKVAIVLQHLEQNSWDVDSLTEALSDNDMRILRLNDRLRLINHIASDYVVGDDDENTIIRLLATAPPIDTARVISGLRRENAALLQTLERAIDGEEYRQYHQVLRALFFGTMSPENARQKMEQAQEFPWAIPGLVESLWGVRFHYDPIEFTNDGKLSIGYWVLAGPIGMRIKQNVQVSPFEMIRVRFHGAETEMNAAQGDTRYMPAINLVSLYNKQFRQELSTVVDVSLLVAGGMGIVGATTRARRLIAALDLLLSASDLAVRTFRNNIARLQGGREFLNAWDILNSLIMIYTVGSVLLEAPRAFRRLRETYRNFRSKSLSRLSPDQANALENEIQRISQQADEAQAELRANQIEQNRRQVSTTPNQSSGTSGSSAGNATHSVHAPQTRHVKVNHPITLARYEELATQKMSAIVTDVLRRHRSTPMRRRLQQLHNEFETLRKSVLNRTLTVNERARAFEILRQARKLARKDFKSLQQAVWRRFRKDSELSRLADEMVAAGDARFSRSSGPVQVHTHWDDGREGFQALEIEHKTRVSDNPWRYNDPDNLILTDSSQNQQFLEALRREGGIWPTDDIEHFIISHGLLEQSNMRAPGTR